MKFPSKNVTKGFECEAKFSIKKCTKMPKRSRKAAAEKESREGDETKEK